MNKALRKAIIAGNWKMNKNRKEAAELIEACYRWSLRKKTVLR